MYIRVRLSHVCLASSLSRHDTLGPKGTHGVCRAMCFHIFGARHTAEANPTRPLRILAQEVGSELRLRCVLYYAQKGCPWSRPRVSLSIYLSTQDDAYTMPAATSSGVNQPRSGCMGGKGSSSGALPQKVTAGDELAARPSPRPRRAIAARSSTARQVWALARVGSGPPMTFQRPCPFSRLHAEFRQPFSLLSSV